MTAARILWLLAIIAITVPRAYSWTSAEETHLRGNLTVGYDSSVRPSDTVNVSLTLFLTNIGSVDLKTGAFQVSGFWEMIWRDNRLSWDPLTYADIDYIFFYEDTLWTPAFVVSNSLVDLSAIDEDTIPMQVSSTGEIKWNPPGILTVGCDMDTTFFPFDIQTCYIEVTSMGYSRDELRISSTEINLMHYSTSGDWEVMKSYTNVDSFTANLRTYSRARYYIKMARLNTYHWLNIILPVFLNGYLIVLVFKLPADSGEKMGYTLTTLLAYVVVLTLLSDGMPTSAKYTSVLEVYLVLVLTHGALSVIMSIWVLYYHFMPDGIEIQDSHRKLNDLIVKIDKFLSFGGNKSKKNDEETNHSARNTSHTPVVKMQLQNGWNKKPIEKDDENKEEPEQELTFQLLAHRLDSLMFKTYVTCLTSLTLIVFTILFASRA